MSYVPKDWIGCPKKSYLIGGKFVAFKTPLDSKFKLKNEDIFTPQDVFDWLSKSKLKIGLWIDLTKTARYYKSTEVTKHKCSYQKIFVEGHGCVPSPIQVRDFCKMVDDFFLKNPNKIIGVHCTHGYNRTGYLIVTYLIKRMGYNVIQALKEFAKRRPPGIYREQYVTELCNRYHGDINKYFIATPFWIVKPLPSLEIQNLQQMQQNSHQLPHNQKEKMKNIPLLSSHSVEEPDIKKRAHNKRKWKIFDEKRREKRKNFNENSCVEQLKGAARKKKNRSKNDKS